MNLKARILDGDGIDKALNKIAREIVKDNAGELSSLALVGVRTRGVPLAKRIAAYIKKAAAIDAPIGVLDITLYRDDLGIIGEHPVINSTEIEFNVIGRTVVIVDDVLFTGRTVKAAIDAVMEYGRPKKIGLAVLIDRGRRELPIKADYIGKRVATEGNERVVVRLKETDGGDCDCAEVYC
ncbi:MAG: bifunctional pyr operon transcriptional regulator/uracil phosphoribosyltransferase PyrR [Clostridiales bacterium]|jgi:pyrimidine operon attenuation protein/uracil phosphoribosyltransferase|nr:bifunctional pyr operon transcriptional regulator/uracil phosphoribosyltransferase PyrR [Clostridiales bacterium]